MAASGSAPRVAVEPKGTRDWLRDAVEAGGGLVVDPGEADALVWTAPGLDDIETADDPAGLGELLAAHPSLRWIQLPWAGVELYHAAGVLDEQRLWTCGKGLYGPPVAEHALTLTLAGLRDLKRFAARRSWSSTDAGVSLVGGAVTIFGGGGIARSLVSLLQPFDCRIQVVRRHDAPVAGAHVTLPFEQRYEALAGVDAVILALALTPETEGLISDIELELMEPHAWLVNVARGRHIVAEHLVAALREDAIGGAALDVTDPEPLPAGHPLWDLPNCLITPHVANTEDMAIPLLSQRVADNVARFAAGEPLLGRVDPQLGY